MITKKSVHEGLLTKEGVAEKRVVDQMSQCDACAGSLAGPIWCLLPGFCVITILPVLIQSLEVWLKNIENFSNPDLPFYLPCESHEDSSPTWRGFLPKETATKSVSSTSHCFPLKFMCSVLKNLLNLHRAVKLWTALRLSTSIWVASLGQSSWEKLAKFCRGHGLLVFHSSAQKS